MVGFGGGKGNGICKFEQVNVKKWNLFQFSAFCTTMDGAHLIYIYIYIYIYMYESSSYLEREINGCYLLN